MGFIKILGQNLRSDLAVPFSKVQKIESFSIQSANDNTEYNDIIMLLNNWFLANNGIITAWVPKAQHCSKAHEPLKHCHTAGRTSSFMKPGDMAQPDNMAMPGDTAKQLSIEYEYTIPLSGMKKISDDVWCGFYQQVYVEFAFANHKQAQVLGINQFMNIGKQTREEIDAIVARLAVPEYKKTTKHRFHNFRVSAGLVLCNQCGEFLADIKKQKQGETLPACLG